MSNPKQLRLGVLRLLGILPMANGLRFFSLVLALGMLWQGIKAYGFGIFRRD